MPPTTLSEDSELSFILHCLCPTEIPSVNPPSRPPSNITSRDVLSDIRVYNMALSMASTGHQNMSPGWGMFTLGGKTYHRMSANFINPRGPPAFAQIYVLDTVAATTRRLALFPDERNQGASHLQADILSELHELLLQHNPFIGQFRSAGLGNQAELVWSCSGSVNMDGMGLGAMVP